MMTSRRSMLLATGSAGLAALGGAGVSAGNTKGELDHTTAELATKSVNANAALVRGDIASYRTFIKLADDFTLMSPFGGKTGRGADITDERWAAMSRFFRNGTLKQEIVETYSSPDIVVLVLIEHGTGEVGGLPDQVWLLRVTLVYRREGDDWLLAHRHADPLVKDLPLRQAAALARR
jgi:ketosteroid isomerase-like protein